jgi:Domain of unknown function (DUF4201)
MMHPTQKLEAQLAHKREVGEVLHAVDYDQLKIENAQHQEHIDARNRELVGLKLSTGRTVQACAHGLVPTKMHASFWLRMLGMVVAMAAAVAVVGDAWPCSHLHVAGQIYT